MDHVTHRERRKLSAELSRMASRHMRSVIQGADIRLSEIADKPGMPGVTAISKYQNGDDPASWLNRTYLFVLALALCGAPRDEIQKLSVGLDSAIATVFACLGHADQLDLREALLSYSDVDHAEEPAERRVWLEGLSTPALMEYLPMLEEEDATVTVAKNVVQQELTERRLA